MDFATRAARLDEQIGLLRALWTDESVSFEGRFHTVTGAGLAPGPVQRPIPIWLGAMAEPALRRVGRLADGWFPQARPGGGLEAALEVVATAATAAGRDPAAIGMEGQVLASTAGSRAPGPPRRQMGGGGGDPSVGEHDGRRLLDGRRAHRRYHLGVRGAGGRPLSGAGRTLRPRGRGRCSKWRWCPTRQTWMLNVS